MKYVQFLFSDAVPCWLKSRSKPCDLTPCAFFLLLGSSAVWWPHGELVDQTPRGTWHQTVLAACETVVVNLSHARARELMRCLFRNIIFLQERWDISVAIQRWVSPRQGKWLSGVTAKVLLLTVDSSECRRNGVTARRSRRWPSKVGGYLFLAALFRAVSSWYR